MEEADFQSTYPTIWSLSVISHYIRRYWIEGEQKKDEVVIRLYYIYWLMITNYLPLLHGRIVLQLLDLLVKV